MPSSIAGIIVSEHLIILMAGFPSHLTEKTIWQRISGFGHRNTVSCLATRMAATCPRSLGGRSSAQLRHSAKRVADLEPATVVVTGCFHHWIIDLIIPSALVPRS